MKVDTAAQSAADRNQSQLNKFCEDVEDLEKWLPARYLKSLRQTMLLRKIRFNRRKKLNRIVNRFSDLF